MQGREDMVQRDEETGGGGREDEPRNMWAAQLGPQGPRWAR